MDNSFGGLAVVAAIAFAAPLVLGLVPGLRLLAVVLELVAGIAVGPSALGWVEAEGPVRTLALIGLAFLLLLAAFLLLALFVVLAERFGIETILGAFLAGATLKLVDRDRAMTHPRFHEKLEVVGFGVFVPFFFVASGAQLDLDALLESGAALALVPIVLASLLVVRGVPALLYGLDRPHTAAAALLQATSLGFLVVASRLGMDLGLIDDATGAALVAGGLLSVLIFPAAALAALRRNGTVTPANGKRREAR